MLECGIDVKCLTDSLLNAIADLPRSMHEVMTLIDMLPENALRDALKEAGERVKKLCEVKPPPIKALSLIRAESINDAETAQCIAMILLDAGKYGESISFTERALQIEGNSPNSGYLRALLNIAIAGDLVRSSQLSHLENNHEEEKRRVMEGAKHYLNASAIYDELGEAEHADITRFNAIDAMAKYYFLHGDLDEALAQYSRCNAVIKDEDMRNRCKSMKSFLEAVMEGTTEKYEEAGDELISIEMFQYAAMAYGAAYQLSGEPRMYLKYMGALMNYVDGEVRGRYGKFEDLIGDVERRGIKAVANEVDVDEESLQEYIDIKALLENGVEPDVIIRYLARDEDVKEMAKSIVNKRRAGPG